MPEPELTPLLFPPDQSGSRNPSSGADGTVSGTHRRKREQWRLLAEGAPDDATAAYLHDYFEPTARAIDGLEKALAGLGLLDDALALDLRKPQDYFRHVWSTAFRAADLAAAGAPDGGAGEADGQYDTGENEYDDAGAHA